jgi:hypothetical protein
MRKPYYVVGEKGDDAALLNVPHIKADMKLGRATTAKENGTIIDELGRIGEILHCVKTYARAFFYIYHYEVIVKSLSYINNVRNRNSYFGANIGKKMQLSELMFRKCQFL